MRLFVLLNLFEASADPWLVAGSFERRLIKLVETFMVEGVLDLLEGDGELKDFSVYRGDVMSDDCDAGIPKT